MHPPVQFRQVSENLGRAYRREVLVDPLGESGGVASFCQAGFMQQVGGQHVVDPSDDD
jgi:hypothetical protein